MIRGTTAQFKFNMPKSFDDFCIIEVIFGQEGNMGTIEAPLPIKKKYDRGYVKVTQWQPVGKNIENIYFDGNEYYRYEDNKWVTYSPGLIEIYPISDGVTFDAENPRILLVNLTPLETMRFSDKRKGYVQILGYCDTDDIVIGSYDEKFMIYPVRTSDIDKLLPINPSVTILDAGEI